MENKTKQKQKTMVVKNVWQYKGSNHAISKHPSLQILATLHLRKYKVFWIFTKYFTLLKISLQILTKICLFFSLVNQDRSFDPLWHFILAVLVPGNLFVSSFFTQGSEKNLQ